MSHFNAVINSTATLIAFDFYKVWKPEASDEKLIRVGKTASVVIAVVSLLVAPLLMYAPDGIYTVMRRFTGFYNIPIIAVVLVGFFSKKIGAFPAKMVLLLHVIVYTLGILVFQVDKLLGINFIHIMGILFVCEVSLMVLLGMRHRRAKPYEPQLRQTGDLTPWRHASTMSVFLLAMLVSIYLTLSPIGVARQGGVTTQYEVLIVLTWCVAFGLMALFRRRASTGARALQWSQPRESNGH
jgi:solute:Na+ symporter, SSS family